MNNGINTPAGSVQQAHDLVRIAAVLIAVAPLEGAQRDEFRRLEAKIPTRWNTVERSIARLRAAQEKWAEMQNSSPKKGQEWHHEQERVALQLAITQQEENIANARLAFLKECKKVGEFIARLCDGLPA